MKSDPDLAKLADDYRALISSQRSLLLATSNSEGDAEISYAPYVRIEQAYYIFVSELARHTGNMLRSRRASVMFIQPETEAANLFARRRLIFSCRVAEIRADDARYTPILDAMRQACGDVVGLLSSLTDFHLLALAPRQGQYVAGFGKAYAIDMDDGSLLPMIK
jgi:putative heme iron utilization protein